MTIKSCPTGEDASGIFDEAVYLFPMGLKCLNPLVSSPTGSRMGRIQNANPAEDGTSLCRSL